MILYATKQTIKELNIPMPEELYNRKLSHKILSEQTNDKMLEWGIKIFDFDGKKCIQAVNFASKMGIFLFDIKLDEIQWIANGIAIYLRKIYNNDKEMLEILERFFNDYPNSIFSKLTNKSVIASLNHNQYSFADDGYRFYEYIHNNILKSIDINYDFNWKYLTTINKNGKKTYDFPANVFKQLLFERYKNS